MLTLRVSRSDIMALLMVLLVPMVLMGQVPAEESPWTVEPWPADNASVGLSPEGIDLSQYREFIREGPATDGFQAFNLSGSEPSVLLALGMAIPWSMYQPPGPGPQLWIGGGDSWAQYAALPQNGFLELIAFSSRGGQARLSRFTSSGSSGENYSLAAGYQKMTVHMAIPGRTLLLLEVDGQPGNAVIADVISADAGSEARRSLPEEVLKFSPENAVVKIVSEGVLGYDVYVDGVYNRNEGSDGAVDGTAILPVKGNKIHTIAVVLRGDFGTIPFRREFNREFKSGNLYTLRL
ncbi:MAG: hypothetical protein GKC10_07010 [Methanosarcinales archaeon]|nr:hypothetical protein [Methanosarcinales archaeon]